MGLEIEAIGNHYQPTAIYYDEADLLEYIRRDVPSVNRRVDDILTLVFEMHNRELIGVKLKGFRYFYNKMMNKWEPSDSEDFVLLTAIFERLITQLGDGIFAEEDRKRAYEQAMEIAAFDHVKVPRDQIAA